MIFTAKKKIISFISSFSSHFLPLFPLVFHEQRIDVIATNSSEFICLQFWVGRFFYYLFFFPTRRSYCIHSLLLPSRTYARPLPPCTSISSTPPRHSPRGGITTESSLCSQPIHLVPFPSQGLLTPPPHIHPSGPCLQHLHPQSPLLPPLRIFSLLPLESALFKVVPASFPYLLFIRGHPSDVLPSFWPLFSLSQKSLPYPHPYSP